MVEGGTDSDAGAAKEFSDAIRGQNEGRPSMNRKVTIIHDIIIITADLVKWKKHFQIQRKTLLDGVICIPVLQFSTSKCVDVND